MKRANHRAKAHQLPGLVAILMAVNLALSPSSHAAAQPSTSTGRPPGPSGGVNQASAGDPRLIGFYTATRIGNATTVADLEANSGDGKGVIPAEQMSALKNQPCTLTIYTNHTFIVSNFPSPISPTRLISIPGNWSLKAYQFMDAHRFRISISGGAEVKLVRASCPADMLPDERWPYLELYCVDARGQGLSLTFKKLRDDPRADLQNSPPKRVPTNSAPTLSAPPSAPPAAASATMWEVASGRAIQSFHGHNRPATAAAFSPDGARLVTGSLTREIILWDTATGLQITNFAPGFSATRCLTFADAGKSTLACNSLVFLCDAASGAILRPWDVASGRQIRSFPAPVVTSLVFSPDGSKILTGGYGQWRGL